MTLKEKVLEVLKYRLDIEKSYYTEERRMRILELEGTIDRIELYEENVSDAYTVPDLEIFNGLYQFQLYKKTSAEKKEDEIKRFLNIRNEEYENIKRKAISWKIS